MHLSEGILPATWAAAHYAAAAPFILAGAHKIKKLSLSQPAIKPLTALVGASVFVISALPIPVPVSGTCAHPTGVGLAALLLGPLPAAAVTLVALLIQALFMAHGGLSTLGANTFNMGVIGAFAGYSAFLLCRQMRLSMAVGAFTAGFVADLSTYAGTATSMALALHGDTPIATVWLTIALAFVPTQLPLAILEGIITAGIFTFIEERRPDILAALKIPARKPGRALAARWWAISGGIFLVALVSVSLLQASPWEGVDVAVVGKYAEELGAVVRQPFLNIEGDLQLFVFAIAGVVGGFIVGFTWRGLLARRQPLKTKDEAAV